MIPNVPRYRTDRTYIVHWSYMSYPSYMSYYPGLGRSPTGWCVFRRRDYAGGTPPLPGRSLYV